MWGKICGNIKEHAPLGKVISIKDKLNRNST